MNIKRAKEEIKHTVQAYLAKDEFGEYRIPLVRQRPVLLMGPPGIGKTAIMEQIARECQIGLVAYTITHHTRQSAIGLPFIEKKQYGGKEYSITEYTMSEIIAAIYEKIEQTGLSEGILFIDEINCVSETLAPTMLQFLQCKTFGNHQIPKGWIIVAAGNPPEYNKSVRDFDIVTLDRVKKIDVREDYGVWKEYAYEAGIHGAILSYLELKKQNFYQIETTVTGKKFITARGWEDLSEMLTVYEELNLPVDYEVVIQYLQQETVAKDFANYLELYREYEKDYQVKELLYGRFQNGMVDRVKRAPFDEKISVISLLLSGLFDSFKKSAAVDAYVTELFESLKEAKAVLLSDANQETLSYELIRRQVDLREEELEKKIEAGLYTRQQEKCEKQVNQSLSQYAKALKKDNRTNPEEAFSWIREEFEKEVEKRQTQIEESASFLEHAFDFMEMAFLESQEMVVFLTELTANRYSASFIQENGCDRYYQYNKKLLFGEQQREILSGIDEVKKLWKTQISLS
jgi:hypothetical protein